MTFSVDTTTNPLYREEMKVLFFNDSMLPKNVFLTRLHKENFIGRLNQGSHVLVDVDVKPGQVLIFKEWENVVLIGADDDVHEEKAADCHL